MDDESGETQSAGPSRLRAVLEGVFVSLTWATTFVLVKIALEDLGPLTIAGGRYFLGFLCLLPFMLRSGQPRPPLSRSMWLKLLALGLMSYTIGNGAAFWALRYLPATTAGLFNAALPIVVLVGSVIWLKEQPTWLQGVGLLIAAGGAALFFISDPELAVPDPIGVVLLAWAVVMFALFGLLGREVARGGTIDTLRLTALPLALGGTATVVIALIVEGVPALALRGWLIVLFLAVFNTALGYMAYNHALRTLTAVEMNVILNITPLGTALFAWILLGERLLAVQIAGMFIVIAGVVLVQVKRLPRLNTAEAVEGL